MKSLPRKPNLDFLKKEARKLRKLHRQQDPASCSRIRHFDTAFSGKSNEQIFSSKFSILDAQRVVAREHGFSSWTKLKRCIESTNSRFNQNLHDELIALRDRDISMRQKLLSENVLYNCYHSDMETVHIENAQRLEDIINLYGWPGTSIVGLDGCRAAALVAQHAISCPKFQKRCLSLISQAAQDGEVPTRIVAFLTDIIRFHEQKPQLFGLVGDWNEHGELSYGEIIDQGHVNERRALAGLNSIEEDLAEHQKNVRNEGGKPPADSKTYQKSKTQWAKKVGWI